MRGALVALLLACAACGTQSPAEQLQTELRTVASWAATAQKVCADRQAGRVPAGYALKALAAAQDELQTEDETLAQNSNTPTEQRATARAQVAQVKQAVAEAHDAIARADGGALAAALKRLTDAAAALRPEARGTP